MQYAYKGRKMKKRDMRQVREGWGGKVLSVYLLIKRGWSLVYEVISRLFHTIKSCSNLIDRLNLFSDLPKTSCMCLLSVLYSF